MNTFPRNPVGPGLAVLLACLWLAGCGRPADKPTPPVPEVTVKTIQPQSVVISSGLPGRTAPYRIAEVRARVDGIVLKRDFTEGSDFTEGAYVRQTEATPLAIVQQLDPLYVDVIRSSAELLQLRQDIQQGVVTQTDSRATAVTIKLEDGSTYAHTGTFQFADSTVDPGTGTADTACSDSQPRNTSYCRACLYTPALKVA
ncbi:MAG: hypothetical protein IPK95_12800 [Cellvibrionales bacterium]|nr:hypothetical protein [Cellvibrionales bacterium]